MKPESLIKIKSGQSSNQDPNAKIRNKRLEMRMSSDEFNAFEQKFMVTHHNSMASFARELLLSHCIVQPIPSKKERNEELKKLALALNKIGVNINQIARVLNTKKKEMLNVGMVEDLKRSRQALEKIVEYINQVKKSKK